MSFNLPLIPSASYFNVKSLVHPTSTLMLYIVYGYKPLSLDKIAIIKGEKGMEKAKRINEILSGKCYSKCK